MNLFFLLILMQLVTTCCLPMQKHGTPTTRNLDKSRKGRWALWLMHSGLNPRLTRKKISKQLIVACSGSWVGWPTRCLWMVTIPRSWRSAFWRKIKHKDWLPGLFEIIFKCDTMTEITISCQWQCYFDWPPTGLYSLPLLPPDKQPSVYSFLLLLQASILHFRTKEVT